MNKKQANQITIKKRVIDCFCFFSLFAKFVWLKPVKIHCYKIMLAHLNVVAAATVNQIFF